MKKRKEEKLNEGILNTCLCIGVDFKTHEYMRFLISDGISSTRLNSDTSSRVSSVYNFLSDMFSFYGSRYFYTGIFPTLCLSFYDSCMIVINIVSRMNYYKEGT